MYIDVLDVGNLGVMIYATLPVGPTDAWAPVGYGPGVDAIVITPDNSGSTLNGLSGGTADRRVTLFNVGPGAITVAYGASLVSGNGFINPSGASLTIPQGGGVTYAWDQTNNAWRAISIGAGGSIPFEFLGDTPPLASETMGLIIFAQPASFAANFAGSYGACLTNPTDSFTITVNHNGSPTGSIVIGTGGSFTFTLASPLTVAAGDTLSFIAQSDTDATLADVAWTLLKV